MRIGMRTVKTVISVIFSMAAASSLSLLYWPSAGIIALLSVGNTRKSTLRTGINRIAAFLLATAAAFVSFAAVGYTILGFGFFLLLFIPFAARFKLTEGIVVNAVLVTHYLVEATMSWQLIGNEAALMAIGLVFALVANIYMPDRTRQLQKNQMEIETEFRVILKKMAGFLLSENKEDLEISCEALLTFIRKSQTDAREHQENYWMRQPAYYETYFAMRRAQANVIKDMLENLERIQQPAQYGKHIYGLLIYTAETFSETNDGKQILLRIEEVYDGYRKMALPESRAEFEDRAELFQFLQSFKSFVEIKAEFFQQKEEK